MKKLITVLTFALLILSFHTLQAQESSLVYPGGDGKLVYAPHAYNGESEKVHIMPDFSHAGYKGGGVALPVGQVPVKVTLYPLSSGKDRLRIQRAIDQVCAMTPDANGFRGAVLLKAGTYRMNDGNIPVESDGYGTLLTIWASGVVLRGEGQGVDGTVLYSSSTVEHTMITMESPQSSSSVSNTQRITTDYVGTGANTFDVADASGFSVGDTLKVTFTPNQQWLDDIIVNDIIRDTEDYWSTSAYTTGPNRKITTINGNTITIDCPVVQPLQTRYGGGEVSKLNTFRRISNVGVEDLRILGTDLSMSGATSKKRLRVAFRPEYISDSWIHGVTVLHASEAAVRTKDAVNFTCEEMAYLQPYGPISGGWRYSFTLCATSSRVLFQRCFSEEGRHDVSTSQRVPGPNVFLDIVCENGHNVLGPHHRWATGTLYDNIKSDTRMEITEFANPGGGHAWCGAQTVGWNLECIEYVCDAARGAQNYAIGCIGTETDGNQDNSNPGIYRGFYESHGTHVATRSLYLKQLEDRLGADALANITTPEQREGNIYSLLADWAGKRSFTEPMASIAAPGNMHSSAYSYTENDKYITLVWTDNATNETKFILERSSDGGEAFEVLAELDANTETYHDADIQQDTYHYRLKAVNDSEESSYANILVYLAFELPSVDVTFKVDLNKVTDLFAGGNVWVSFSSVNTRNILADEDKDGIYEAIIPIVEGTALKYNFAYQTGADADNDYNEETLSADCSTEDGYRLLNVGYLDITLPAVVFGSCYEAFPDGIDITDFEGTVIIGSNDNEPWLGADGGAGSPDGEGIENLIDNNVSTKYLVRAIESWIEIETNTFSVVTGYTITSANDAPTRDPKTWEFQGWDENTGVWITLHTVTDNPSWPAYKTPKSWTFENDKQFKKYRLSITEINDDPQSLMQISELQIWGVQVVPSNIKVIAIFSENNIKCYPNPFKTRTQINFTIPYISNVKLAICDIFGRTLEVLVDKKMDTGTYETEWNALNYASGIYFMKILVDGTITTKKLILNK
jgi:hypothetical protein